RWRVNDAGGDLSVLLETDQRREVGDAANEVLGAVDRINDPSSAAAAVLAELFADDAVVRERGAQHLDDPLLTFAVGARDRGAVALELDRQPTAEIAQCHLARRARRGNGNFQSLVHGADSTADMTARPAHAGRCVLHLCWTITWRTVSFQNGVYAASMRRVLPITALAAVALLSVVACGGGGSGSSTSGGGAGSGSLNFHAVWQHPDQNGGGGASDQLP